MTKKKKRLTPVWARWTEVPHYKLGEAPENFTEQHLQLYRCCVAKRAMMAAYEIEETSPRGDVEAAVTDLLTDLRHLCRQLEIDYSVHDKQAQEHFSEEQQQDDPETVRTALYDNPETSCRERYQAGKLIGLVTAFLLPQEGRPDNRSTLPALTTLPALPFRSGQIIGDVGQLPRDLQTRLGYNAAEAPA